MLSFVGSNACKVLALSALLVSGCTKKPKPPSSLRWDGGLAFIESAGDEVSYRSPLSVGVEKTDFVVRWMPNSDSAKLRVGGKEFSGASLAEAHVPLGEGIGKLGAASAFDPLFTHDFGLEVEVTIDGGSVRGKVPRLAVAHGLRGALEILQSGTGVDLGVPSGAGYGVIAYGPATMHLYGSPKTLGDVTRAAFETQLPARPSTKACGSYTAAGKTDGKTTSLLLAPIDSQVVVYEVKTGKRLEAKVFPAQDECPSLTVAVKGTYAESYPDAHAIEAWVTGFSGK